MASLSGKYPCNTCSETFNNSAEQREHMRGDWHISNLRRKVAGEIPESEETYRHSKASPARKSPVPVVQPNPSSTPKKRSPSPTTKPEILPTNCLYCSHTTTTIEKNLTHMSTAHGMLIPSLDRITDLSSFLTYLASIVHEWHECLYCGVEKGSTQSVQTHMRDKGHCKIDEEEVEEFLEQDDSEEEEEADEGKKLSKTEWKLPSGAIINARSDSPSSPRAALLKTKKAVHRGKKRDEKQLVVADAATPAEPTAAPPSGALAVRNADRSLAGVSEQQVRALVATEKRAKTQAGLAEARAKQRLVREPVLTKYYKTENPVYQAG